MSIKTDQDLFEDSQLEKDEVFQPLTRSEAQALESTMQHVSLWTVLFYQLLAGVIVIAISAIFGWYAFINAMAGALSAWLPAALFAWRVSAINASKHGSGFSLASFYLWEAVKIISTIALLAVAMFWVKPLVWQALLAGFVVTLKAYIFGCLGSLKRNR